MSIKKSFKKSEKLLIQTKKELIKLAKLLPDQDSYAPPYTIIYDMIQDINSCLKDLKFELKEAAKFKTNLPNRAKKWCKIK